MNDEEIVRTYADTVYRVAFNYVRNKYDADDVFSETFLRYFRRPRSFESEEHRRAWLIRVTVNCAKDFLAARSHDIDPDSLPEEGQADPDAAGRLDLQDALLRLPQEDRDILYYFYYEDMSIRAIAALLTMNENTVKTRLARAREKLAAEMTEVTVNHERA